MRSPFVTVLFAGGLLALGAWTNPGQSTESVSAQPTEVDGQPDSEACAPGQAAADEGRRISRTHTRPRASSVRPPAEADCRPAVSMVRRDAHRAHRNAAIDRSLNSGG